MRRPGGMEGEVVGPLLVVEALVGVDIEEGTRATPRRKRLRTVLLRKLTRVLREPIDLIEFNKIIHIFRVLIHY